MPGREGVESLSPRERECLTLAARGLSAKAISRRIGTITDQTVETHLKRGRQKLGLTSSVEAGRMIEDALPTQELDVPPASIERPIEPVMFGGPTGSEQSEPGGGSLVREERLPFFVSPPLRQPQRWLPWRRPGATRIELDFMKIVMWIGLLPFAGAILLLLAATAIAAVGLMWSGNFTHHH